MNKNKVLIWLKEFQCTWLPKNISNDTHILDLIINKLGELEQILSQDHQDENEEISPCTNSNNTEQVVLPVQQPTECLFFTPSDKLNQNSDETNESFSRPAIRIKRISLAEAENFIPASWNTTKSKRGRKKGKKKLTKIISNGKKNKKNKVLLPTAATDKNTVEDNFISRRRSNRVKKTIPPPSATSFTSTQSLNDDKKKSKRKLRAIDAEDDDLYTLGNLSQTDNLNGDISCEQIPRYIGQKGILSQTRRVNETLSTTDVGFKVKLQISKNQNSSRHSNNGDINTMITTEATLVEALPIIENNDTESLFTSLNLTPDKTFETSSSINQNSIINYNDCIEDISNDGIDPPAALSSPNIAQFSLTT